MLEIRTICENCGKNLPNDSVDAMICSFECTFCRDCVQKLLYNVCPNCGGGLENRPIRPSNKLLIFPVKLERYYNPVDFDKFSSLLNKYKYVLPNER